MDDVRVLFVDDEEELVSAVVERLELRGIAAQGATSGRDALELLERESFDVVVLDVKMPGLGGLEVVRQINRRHPGTKVVLMTGHGSVEDSERGQQLGAIAYLQKPVDLDTLIDIVRSAARED
jgi:DNA-binding NtrC family response regulator